MCMHEHASSLSALSLTKNLRGGLMFLNDHMSSPRRDEKHLKVTFLRVCVAAAEAKKGLGEIIDRDS